MMTVRCYLAPSSIEGLGIFCRDPIAKGQVIWQSDPLLDMRIPIDHLGQYPEHVREFIERYAYVDVKNPAMLVLESDEGRFMNHSDRPNTDFTALDHGYALVDIPAGVEITCDYREIGENLVMQPPRQMAGLRPALLGPPPPPGHGCPKSLCSPPCPAPEGGCRRHPKRPRWRSPRSAPP